MATNCNIPKHNLTCVGKGSCSAEWCPFFAPLSSPHPRLEEGVGDEGQLLGGVGGADRANAALGVEEVVAHPPGGHSVSAKNLATEPAVGVALGTGHALVVCEKIHMRDRRVEGNSYTIVRTCENSLYFETLLVKICRVERDTTN